MRFIIYIVLAYVAYRVLKAVIRPKGKTVHFCSEACATKFLEDGKREQRTD
ncbi:MAG: hypothetical protein MUC98_10725 [Desulfobacterota bacterium]|nr:hypothetical protein [Thermodesulfobacteriota bacterium]